LPSEPLADARGSVTEPRPEGAVSASTVASWDVARFALDATPLIEPTGGIARYTRELAFALAREFGEDQFWMLSDQPVPEITPPAPNLHVGSGPGTALERKWWLWGVEREMARHGIELFHGTDFSTPYLARRPSVLTLHDLSPWMCADWRRGTSLPNGAAFPNSAGGRVRRRTPILLRLGLATMTITPTETVRRAAIEKFKLDADRVVAVPLAANENFHPVEVDPPRPYFLFVGTLEPRKNLARLIEAWRWVRAARDIDLVLAGRARPDFAPPPGENGLRVLGAVPEQELARWYSGATACVYPSLYEGFGLPALEAMQCGALAITSRDPAIMEVASGAAIHVDAQDTKALAEAMMAAAREPARFQPLRAKAIERARQFTWQRTACMTREVYDAARRRFRKA
jgi:glycosyltransferase involved in cell wall biosynthesis